MWLLWCSCSDKSDEPSFLGLFKTEDEADSFKEMVDVAEPVRTTYITFVEAIQLATKSQRIE